MTLNLNRLVLMMNDNKKKKKKLIPIKLMLNYV